MAIELLLQCTVAMTPMLLAEVTCGVKLDLQGTYSLHHGMSLVM